MNSASSNNSTPSVSISYGTYRFTASNPYNGNKFDTKDYLGEVATRVAAHPKAHILHEYVNSLFFRNAIDSTKFDLTDAFTLRVMRQRPAAGTPNSYQINKSIDDDSEFNKCLQEAKAILFGILMETSDISFQKAYQPWAKEPYGVIDYINNNFGSPAMGHSEKCAIWERILSWKFKHGDRIPVAKIDFQNLADTVNCADSFILTLLRRTNKDKAILPERLFDAVKHTVTMNMDLKATWQHIIHVDTDFHSQPSALVTPSPGMKGGPRASIKLAKGRINTYPCLNCGRTEPPHIAWQCFDITGTKKCGYCHKTTKPHHHSGECPVRLANRADKDKRIKRKKSIVKRKREDDDDEVEEDDDHEDTNIEDDNAENEDEHDSPRKKDINSIGAMVYRLGQSFEEFKNKSPKDSYFQGDEMEEYTGESEVEVSGVNQVQYSPNVYKLGVPDRSNKQKKLRR